MPHNKRPQNNLNIPGNPNSTKLSTAKNTEEMGYRKRVFAFTQAKCGYVLSSASKEHIQAAVKEMEIITFCGIKSTHTDYLGSYPSTRRPSDPQFPCAEHRTKPQGLLQPGSNPASITCSAASTHTLPHETSAVELAHLLQEGFPPSVPTARNPHF